MGTLQTPARRRPTLQRLVLALAAGALLALLASGGRAVLTILTLD